MNRVESVFPRPVSLRVCMHALPSCMARATQFYWNWNEQPVSWHIWATKCLKNNRILWSQSTLTELYMQNDGCIKLCKTKVSERVSVCVCWRAKNEQKGRKVNWSAEPVSSRTRIFCKKMFYRETIVNIVINTSTYFFMDSNECRESLYVRLNVEYVLWAQYLHMTYYIFIMIVRASERASTEH